MSLDGFEVFHRSWIFFAVTFAKFNRFNCSYVNSKYFKTVISVYTYIYVYTTDAFKRSKQSIYPYHPYRHFNTNHKSVWSSTIYTTSCTLLLIHIFYFTLWAKPLLKYFQILIIYIKWAKHWTLSKHSYII